MRRILRRPEPKSYVLVLTRTAMSFERRPSARRHLPGAGRRSAPLDAGASRPRPDGLGRHAHPVAGDPVKSLVGGPYLFGPVCRDPVMVGDVRRSAKIRDRHRAAAGRQGGLVESRSAAEPALDGRVEPILLLAHLDVPVREVSFPATSRVRSVVADALWYPRLHVDGVDLLHCPSFRGPFAPDIPVVVTVHDLAVFRHPEAFPRWTSTYGRLVVPHMIRAARRAIAVSEFTRAELVELLRVPEERIRAVHAPVGLDLGGRTPAEIALSVLAELSLERHGGSGRPLRLSDELLERTLGTKKRD